MKQLAIAFDQLLNTLVWVKGDGFGFADETLSARAWRMRGVSQAHRIIDAIFFWEASHCQASYESEVLRHQLPGHYRSR